MNRESKMTGFEWGLLIFPGGESVHPAAVIAGLIADNRCARAEFLPRLVLPVFAGRRIVVKCNGAQRLVPQID